MSEELKLVAKVVELRQQGLTWEKVEAAMFPETCKPKGPRVWALALKHKSGAASGAFTKRVLGAWTPFQTVMKLRPRVVSTTQTTTQVGPDLSLANVF